MDYMYLLIIYNIDHSHPTMKIGHPFKFRWMGRPQVGMLNTPDILKYKIPVPFAFVPADPQYLPMQAQTKKPCCGGKKKQLANAADFKVTLECQKTVMNFNNCLKNNLGDNCNYYTNFLNSKCRTQSA